VLADTICYYEDTDVQNNSLVYTLEILFFAFQLQSLGSASIEFTIRFFIQGGAEPTDTFQNFVESEGLGIGCVTIQQARE
jgi:hypothetical protein